MANGPRINAWYFILAEPKIWYVEAIVAWISYISRNIRLSRWFRHYFDLKNSSLYMSISMLKCYIYVCTSYRYCGRPPRPFRTQSTLFHTHTLIYIDYTDIHNPSYTYTAKTATSTYQHKSQQQKHSKQPSCGILLWINVFNVFQLAFE